MARKRRIFGYVELMNALEGANRKELISGIIVMAVYSWNEKEMTRWSMRDVLSKAIERIDALGGNPYEFG